MVAVVSRSQSIVGNGNERPIMSPSEAGTATSDFVKLMIRGISAVLLAAVSETNKTYRPTP